MRKIVLSGIVYPDRRSVRSIERKYRVYIGNGTLCSFNTFAQAEKFLSEANQSINDKFIQINEMIISARIIFHENWFYLDNHQEIESEILESFTIIDKAMLFIINVNGSNSNSWIFSKLLLILNSLAEIYNNLAELVYKRSNYYCARKTRMQIEQIKAIQLYLIDFCKDHPSYITPNERIIPKKQINDV